MSSYYGSVFLGGGAVVGVVVYFGGGSIRLIGGFGGVRLGLIGITGMGMVAGAATYGALKGLKDNDFVALGVSGVGVFDGLGVSATVGGVGLGFGGTAFSIGMGSMAIAGGIVGLGAYGLIRMFTQSDRSGKLYQNLEFFERITQEYEEELFWMELEGKSSEIEQELAKLKAIFGVETETSNYRSTYQNSSNITLIDKLSWQCINQLKGHTAPVNSVAFSPDGQTIASGGDDRTVKLWNRATGQSVHTFFCVNKEIQTVAISPDGKSLIASGFDQRINYWQLETKKYISRFFGSSSSPHSHNGVISQVAFTPSGKFIISASSDKTLRVWGNSTGELKRRLNGHLESVNALAISPDSQVIASGSADATIQLWEIDSSYSDRILKGHSSEVTALAFTPDGNFLISGSADKTIKIWSFQADELIKTLMGHSQGILSIAVSPNGEIFASASLKEVIIWKLATGEILQILAGSAPLAFSSDGQFLVTGGYGDDLKIWCKMLGDVSPILTEFNDWWEVFGVSRSADLVEIKQSYYRLARQYHPDVNSSTIAIKVMQNINHAYEQFLEEFHQRLK